MATPDAVRAKGQVILEAAYWDSVTLAIADAIGKGEPIDVLDDSEHVKDSMDWEKGEINF